MSTTTLAKKQVKHFSKVYQENGHYYKIIAKVKYDDQCENGHNTFSITGEIWKSTSAGATIGRDCETCGCIHEDIAKHFPELAPLIKWHLTSSDGPMHYIANTVYHALEHGPTHAWVSYKGGRDPLMVLEENVHALSYIKARLAQQAEGHPGYTVKWDEKTVKTRNLGHARSSAVWPDATDEDLTAPGLEERLRARLPRLLAEFQAAVESLGFTF